MLIRFYAYFYPPCIGGGEVILQHQAEGLVKRGHQVHVHTTCYANIACSSTVPAGSRIENGVHVHRRRSFLLPFHNPLEKDAVTPSFLADTLGPLDLAVCVGFPSLHLDLLRLRWRYRPFPLVVQNYITADFLKEILGGQGGLNKRLRARYWRHHVKPALQASQLVLADSPGAGAALRSSLGLSNVQVHIGMAVDPAEFDAVAPETLAALRERLGLGKARYLLAPSRVSRQKGADLLIQAAEPLLGPDLKLVICGPVNEPEFLAQIKTLAAPLGEKVKICELERKDFVALIKGASLLCLPSRGETVGGVVFEGMYAGVPCVVSDAVEAAREDYLSPQTGWLFPSENILALRSALQNALLAPPAIIQAAKTMVQERFTWEASVARLENLYEEAIRSWQS